RATMTADLLPVRRALLSVSDKTGLVDLARAPSARGIELRSTGGTARAIREAGLPVKDVSEATGFPEMMDGRVKTLHPVVHGGLLGRAGTDDTVMAEHGIAPIDLLVLNLYPFEQVTANAGCTLAEAVENIDIGGPAMLRSAAKNFARVAVTTSPDQYAGLLAELEANDGRLSAATRFALSVAAFNRVALYDAAVSNSLSAITDASGDVPVRAPVSGQSPGPARDPGATAGRLSPATRVALSVAAFNPVALSDAAISNYLSAITDASADVPVRAPFSAQANGSFVKVMDLRYGENPHQQ